MAQHDYVLSNGSGLAFRADVNLALAAIVSQNSGANAPSTTYAYQWWADTTAGLLKIRNAANNGWISLFELDGTLTMEAGTAAAPGLAVRGDSDTGWFGKAANQLGVSTGGVERGFFDSLGWNGPVNIPSLNGGPLAGFRNVIINGNPTINQRGYVSGAATSGANQYTLDRWRVVTSGQNISFTDSANVRTVTAPAGGCEQVVEGLSILSGTYTLNWTGTATATVNGTAVAKGGNVTLTGGTNATVRFSSGTFAQVQLEPGPVATPFERRLFATELALCQRYFAVIYVSLRGTSISGNLEYTAKFPQTMRAIPSATGFSHPSYTANNVSDEALRQWSSSEMGYGINGAANTDMYVLGRGYILSAEL
jgi:hypothetical protein